MKITSIFLVLLLLAVPMTVIGCGGGGGGGGGSYGAGGGGYTPNPTPTPTTTPSPTPTPTPSPTPTPTPTPTPSPYYQFGWVVASGVGNQTLSLPGHPAIMGSEIAVPNGGNHKITRINISDGSIIGYIENAGAILGTFVSPVAVCCNTNFWFLSDTGNNRIIRFDAGWTNPAAIVPYITQVKDMACDPFGSLFVLRENGEIHVYNFSGTETSTWAASTNLPKGIAWHINRVFITGSHNLVITDEFGQNPFYYGSQGTGDGQYNTPNGVDIGADGKNYIADTFNYRFQTLNADNTFFEKFGTQGTGNGQFQQPFGISVDSNGNVYVTDRTNHNLQKFSHQ